jgi:hypothetical protein
MRQITERTLNRQIEAENIALASLAAQAAKHADAVSDEDCPVNEDCPVIYADRVYLGMTGPRRLRVVCFEAHDARRNLATAG